MKKREEKLGDFVDGFHDLVLFDGNCNLCNASVDFLIQRDVNRRLKFSAQQSPKARAALDMYTNINPGQSAMGECTLVSGEEVSGESDSVLVLGADGVLRDNSAAAVRASFALGFGWQLLGAVGSIVPEVARDYAYGIIGKNRYRWFGKKETCRLPTREERHHFL